MEQYIYLGQQQGAFFFIHTIFDSDKFDKSTSYQIFNCMINETMITTNDKIVIIYEINPKTDTMDVIIIQHYTNENIAQFDKPNLEQQFIKLMNIERNHKILIFLYDNDNNVFYTLEKHVHVPRNLFGEDEVKIRNIDYMLTNKPLD